MVTDGGALSEDFLEFVLERRPAEVESAPTATRSATRELIPTAVGAGSVGCGPAQLAVDLAISRIDLCDCGDEVLIGVTMFGLEELPKTGTGEFERLDPIFEKHRGTLTRVPGLANGGRAQRGRARYVVA
jgi:hypothetical protein